MTAWIIIVFFLFMMYKTAQQPIIGLVFMWFAIWLYPNSLLYGTLPLNIRLDDLFVVFTFLVCMYKKPSYVSIWSFDVFKLSIIWWAVHAIGNINGLLYTGFDSIEEVFKFMLKAAYVPMTIAILITQLKDYDSIKLFNQWLLIAGMMAALVGIGTVLFPETFAIFLIPDDSTLSNKSIVENLQEQLELARRARGSVGIVATSIICLFFSVYNLYLLTFKQVWLFSKKVIFVLFIISFLGLVFTQSRGPLIAFGITSVYILFRSKNIKILVASLAVVGLLFLIENPVRDLIFNRFVGGTGSTLDSGVNIRSNIWRMFIDNLDPILMVNGMGMVSAYKVYNFTAHNTYLGSLVYGGIWGMMLLLFLIVKPLRYQAKLRWQDGMYARFWGGYVMVLLLFMLIIGFSIEDFQQTLCMQLFFTTLLICEKVYVEEKSKEALLLTPNYNLAAFS